MKGLFIAESEWVPVPPKEKKEEDKVFTKPEVPVSIKKTFEYSVSNLHESYQNWLINN